MYFDATKSSLLHDDLSLQEVLSGVTGSISLTAWVFLLVPQLLLNYKARSADGISLTFLSVWMIGDVANLIGAIWATLVPTVVTIAIYFCFTDIALISQSVYYKFLKSRKNQIFVLSHTGTSRIDISVSEDTSLLSGRPTNLNDQCFSSSLAPQQHVEENKVNQHRSWFYNTFFILGIILIGTIGWIVAYYSGIWTPTPAPVPSSSLDITIETPVGAQILGYVSAICYLLARIPQIIKNYREKSCQGLALLFFLSSLLGNTCYGLSILCHSLQKQYLKTNLPWLIGSLGTMAEDIIIFLQFRHYSK